MVISRLEYTTRINFVSKFSCYSFYFIHSFMLHATHIKKLLQNNQSQQTWQINKVNCYKKLTDLIQIYQISIIYNGFGMYKQVFVGNDTKFVI